MPDIIQEAKAQYQKLAKNRESLRFKRVIGRLIQAKLIQAQAHIRPFSGKLSLKEYVWAGQFEPRIFELLPALVIKKPSLFEDIKQCPKDLEELVKDIKAGQATKPYHGILPQSYLRWISHIGHRRKEPSMLKAFRFSATDSEVLRSITSQGYTEIGAVREGLRLLAEKLRSL